MRLLLDTNALLWALTNGPRIEPVRELLLADENEVFHICQQNFVFHIHHVPS